MKILICGVDGYLGWPLALKLKAKGHEVMGIDNGMRRRNVLRESSNSLTPILELFERQTESNKDTGSFLSISNIDITQYESLKFELKRFKPDTIVHLAEMPSAPWSMKDIVHCTDTHRNNVNGTLNILWAMKEVCPNAHLVKLGTMGEYGTPNVDITEGDMELTHTATGNKETAMFPRKPGSFYHLTKVHDTHNVRFACDTWGLRSTDIMQGVVYGIKTDEMGDNEKLLTRFDYDQCFGTCLNRFVTQALIGHPLTVYGEGGQTRGYLSLKDSIQCLTLVIENPPLEGQYRVFNQFEGVYSVADLANKVKKIASEFDLPVEIKHLKNPRKEMEKHYYNPTHEGLLKLGYKPSTDMEAELRIMFATLKKYTNRINKDVIMPTVKWK